MILTWIGSLPVEDNFFTSAAILAFFAGDAFDGVSLTAGFSSSFSLADVESSFTLVGFLTEALAAGFLSLAAVASLFCYDTLALIGDTIATSTYLGSLWWHFCGCDCVVDR